MHLPRHNHCLEQQPECQDLEQLLLNTDRNIPAQVPHLKVTHVQLRLYVQAQAHLSQDFPDGALQSALPVLHARGGRGSFSQQPAPHH
jgi:hypothetical protein